MNQIGEQTTRPRPRTTQSESGRAGMAIAGAIIAFYFTTVVASTSLLAFSCPLGRAPMIVGLAAAIGWTLFAARSVRAILISASSLAILSIIAALLALNLRDLTYDGQVYHQETIIQLAAGWNPLQGDLSPEFLPADESRPLINGFVRGPEIVQAAIYVWARRIELPKMVNLLVLAASMLIAMTTVRQLEIRSRWATAIAVLAALNPVSIYQVFCYYVDGQLASLLLCLICLLILHEREGKRTYLVLGIATTAILLNIKFTAIGFVGVIFAAAALWRAAHRRWRPAAEMALAGAASAILGFVAIGFCPYVTNIQRHGHVFYPLAGPHRIEHNWNNDRPVNFNAMNKCERLFHAIASPPENGFEGDHFTASRFAMPTPSELKPRMGSYAFPDVRVGGFGPLFGIVLVVSFIAGLLSHGSRPAAIGIAFLAGVVVLSAIIHPEVWWARYAPQIYLLAPLFLLLGIAGGRAPARRVAMTGIIVFALSAATVAVIYVGGQIRWTHNANAQLREFRREGRPIVVDFGSFRAVRMRFIEAGIPFVEVDPADRPGSDPERIAGSQAMFYR